MRTSSGDFSRVIFGSAKRLRLFAAVALLGEDDLYATAVAESVGEQVSFVSKELNRLADVGLLIHATAKGSGHKLYKRIESPFWSFVTKLHQKHP
jgi:predicted transcriptional regulator